MLSSLVADCGSGLRLYEEAGGPGVSLTLCCFVLILRGELFYVLPCAILFLCFSVLFNIAITSLGEERANLSAFRTFVRFALVWFCLFPLPLSVCRAAACVCGTPWTFSLPFFFKSFIRGFMANAMTVWAHRASTSSFLQLWPCV